METYVALGYIIPIMAITLAASLYAKHKSWKLLTVQFIGTLVGIWTLLFLAPVLTGWLVNINHAITLGKSPEAARLMTIAEVSVFIFSIYLIIRSRIPKLNSKFGTWVAINLSLTIALINYGFLIDSAAEPFAFSRYLLIISLFFTAGAAILFWYSNWQNTFAPFVGYFISIFCVILYYYCITGIWVINSDPASWSGLGFWVIILTIGFAFAIVYYRPKEFYLRWPHRMNYVFQLVILVLAFYGGIVNFFGSHAELRFQKAMVNNLNIERLTTKLNELKGEEMTTALNGTEVKIAPNRAEELQAKRTAKTLSSKEFDELIAYESALANRMEQEVGKAPFPSSLHSQTRLQRFKENIPFFGRFFREKTLKESSPIAYPTWREVYRQTFTGVGYTGGDILEDNDGSIETAQAGKDYQIGYRCTVIDTDFEIWREGGWQKFKQGEWLTVNTMTPGNYATFRNEPGKKFTVVFQKR